MKYRIDPELAPAVDALSQMATPDFGDVAAARASIVDMLQVMNEGVDRSGLAIEDKVVAGDVPVRVYAPEVRDALLPAILHIHGGGFVVGNLDTELGSVVRMAREVPAVVVSVDYRLAPEHPFPAGLDDCFAALEWLHSEARGLGVGADRIALYGGSAGGGLAAAVALLARDRGGPPLCFQFLGQPELDDRLETPSMRAFVDTPIWNRPSAANSWLHYLGPDPGEVSPYAAPARATDLTGLPPAYVSTMEFDPMRDEGISYALRLLQAGVSVELHQLAGTFHGSSMVTTADSSQRQVAETLHVLRRALHGPS